MTPAGESVWFQPYGAEGATAPETLRLKDRLGDDTLESSRRLTISRRLTEGRNFTVASAAVVEEISQVTGQRGRMVRFQAGPTLIFSSIAA
jgi:hypothetical protein